MASLTPLTTNDRDDKFYKRLQRNYETVQAWDASPELLQQRREELPWEFLRTGHGMPDLDGTVAEQHKGHSHLVALQRLVRWFQQSMTWVNTPPCVDCGSANCKLEKIRGPVTQEERMHQANRVEVYRCGDCNSTNTIFPRYNNVTKLCETRKGRCGEYANLFGLTCRAAGFETRYVLDVTDHVWTECYIPSLEEWVMADGCEGIINEPGMYEHGWGKQGLCYMIAMGIDHILDVTPRYTRNFLTPALQAARRNHTSSELISTRLLDHFNATLQNNLTQARRDELHARRQREMRALEVCQQSTAWDRQQQYNLGRISGSLEWKQSRSEDGGQASHEDEDHGAKIYGFQVESFVPQQMMTAESKKTITLSVHHPDLVVKDNRHPRHGQIQVCNVPCAAEGPNDDDTEIAVSVVVLDDAPLGCILQCKAFETWHDLAHFVSRLKPNKIVIANGVCKTCASEDDDDLRMLKERLGGWSLDVNGTTDEEAHGFAYIGMVDCKPDWATWKSHDDLATAGYQIQLQHVDDSETVPWKLRTVPQTQPKAVIGRLPESVMPLATQQLATQEQKRTAFLSYCSSPWHKDRMYSGYTTKNGSPVYLLGPSSFPFHPSHTSSPEDASADADGWSTYYFLPEDMVTSSEQDVVHAETPKKSGKQLDFDIPLDTQFFDNALGDQLMVNGFTYHDRLSTPFALHNTRLVGLYFSAHWCGPCRRFTPMLAEMYTHLRDAGLEIVFVSSDRDEASFQQYYGSMPWKAVPFDRITAGVKQRLSSTYGVRGIPSFVVLDSMSGEIVVPASESRTDISMACQRGEEGIERMMDSWLARIPRQSQEMLRMLELSCETVNGDQTKEHNSPSQHDQYVFMETPKRLPKQPTTNDELKENVKELFAKFIAQGAEPTTAAAQAIEAVAAQQEGTAQPYMEPGSLDGAAVGKGSVDWTNVDTKINHTMGDILKFNMSDDVKLVLNTAVKYLKNCAKKPCNPKFRIMKLSNTVADRMFRMPGGVQLLEAIGFEVFGTSQDFVAAIPLTMELEKVIQKCQELVEKVDADTHAIAFSTAEVEVAPIEK